MRPLLLNHVGENFYEEKTSKFGPESNSNNSSSSPISTTKEIKIKNKTIWSLFVFLIGFLALIGLFINLVR